MKRGTKSVLFGVHQFLLHPLFVLVAWFIVHGKAPNMRELAAIITHDLGYLGSPNMDGPEGEQHPEKVAQIWRKHFGSFGADVSDLVLGHSRFHAAEHGFPLSKLFQPDKLSSALYPAWLYLLLGNLSGEIGEYMERCSGGKYEGLVGKGSSQIRWLIEVRAVMSLMGIQGEKYAPVSKQMKAAAPVEPDRCCGVCGYTWKPRTDGVHDCSYYLRQRESEK